MRRACATWARDVVTTFAVVAESSGVAVVTQMGVFLVDTSATSSVVPGGTKGDAERSETAKGRGKGGVVKRESSM